jgi:hypothetical protein
VRGFRVRVHALVELGKGERLAFPMIIAWRRLLARRRS